MLICGDPEVNKRVALLLISILAVSSLMLVESAFAQSIPKPSVPEFTVNLVSHPYTVVPNPTTDPYTGKVTTYPAYINENKSLEIKIKNQPHNSYQMADGNWSRLYYNLRYKPHFSLDDWVYYPISTDADYAVNVNASLFEYTVISLDSGLYGYLILDSNQIDFQVRALTGYDEARYGVSGNTGELIWLGNHFTGEKSDWSTTQRLIIPTLPSSSANLFSPTTNSTSPASTTDQTTEPALNDTSQTLQLEIIIGTLVTIFLAIISLLIYHKRRRDSKPCPTVPNNN